MWKPFFLIARFVCIKSCFFFLIEKTMEIQKTEPAVIPQHVEAKPHVEHPKGVKQYNFFITSSDKHIKG